MLNRLSVVAVAVTCVKVVPLVGVHVVVLPPKFRAVAAPKAFTVVAVVFATANVVEGVVIEVVTAMPNTNGTLAVVAWVPSFSTQVVRPVAMSESVLLLVVLLIVVPVTTGFPATRLKVPLEKLMVAVLVVKGWSPMRHDTKHLPGFPCLFQTASSLAPSPAPSPAGFA